MQKRDVAVEVYKIFESAKQLRAENPNLDWNSEIFRLVLSSGATAEAQRDIAANLGCVLGAGSFDHMTRNFEGEDLPATCLRMAHEQIEAVRNCEWCA
ncbi:MAG: hypothetical protein OXI23_12555 [Gemmatimonadota bacterium]|nr:hypothetical protein [Gemmatimonadota bacterium]